jgi:hypothetical protein
MNNSARIPWTAIVAGIATIWLLAGCGGTERVYYLGGNSYMPLREGRQLQYEQQTNGEIRPYMIVMHYAGGHITKVFPLEVDGINLGECSFLSHDSTVLFSTSAPLTSIVPKGTLPEYRQMWVDTRAKPGDTWRDDDTGTRTTVMESENADTPSGTYKDCYKTMTEALPELFDTLTVRRDRGELVGTAYDRELKNAQQVIVRWFAQGVGLVREQIGSDVIRVLNKVEKEGVGVTDTTRQKVINIQG